MSRKDNCLDNTMAESFFGIILYAENFESTEAFIKALDNYIEYYNNKSQVKWKESGAIPNSFNNWIMFNQSNFLGVLQQSYLRCVSSFLLLSGHPYLENIL